MPKGYVQNVHCVLKCKLEDLTTLSVIVRFQVPLAAMLPFDGAVCVKSSTTICLSVRGLLGNSAMIF